VEFNHQTELTVNSITPDMQAEARAKILLLDQKAAQDVNRFYYMSFGSRISIEESPFPALFQQIKQPGSFRQAVTLVATWYLHMNNIVEHILKLDLQLKGQQLKVQFEGQRSAYYQERPTIIRVTGLCDLSRPVQEQALRLGPVNRY